MKLATRLDHLGNFGSHIGVRMSLGPVPLMGAPEISEVLFIPAKPKNTYMYSTVHTQGVKLSRG